MYRLTILKVLALCLLLGSGVALSTPDPEAWRMALAKGLALRNAGKIAESITVLQEARRLAEGTTGSSQAAAALGSSLMQAHRIGEAEAPLLEGHGGLAGEAKGAIANHLGNLYYAQHNHDLAVRFYREAIESSDLDSGLWLTASLNLSRTRPPEKRLELLSVLRQRLEHNLNSTEGVALLINLGVEAISLGKSGQPLAHDSLERARGLAAAVGNLRLELEALEALGRLYETAGRWPDALVLTQQALTMKRDNVSVTLEDILLQLEWRQARAYQSLRQPDPALAAYQRAVDLARQIRQDLPIEFMDGRSSYQAIIQPLYLGYIELLLDSLEQQPLERQQQALGRVRDAIEILHQSEMQDFLGDRCSLEEVNVIGKVEQGTAILYPVLLRDRVELLLETNQGLVRWQVPTAGALIRETARDFASALRSGDASYKVPARRLHDALIAPIDHLLTEQQVRTLVIVPDGELRLVPFAALLGDRGFLVERYAIGAVTGMSMTNLSLLTGKTPKSLLAGVAEPGGVIDKLADVDVVRSAGGGTSRGLRPGGKLVEGRTLRSTGGIETTTYLSRDARLADLKKSLALPGVRDEIKSVGSALAGNVLLDDAFTIGRFRDEAEAGGYGIVHIASHGVFGGSAESSFILAFDDLLSINRLQTVLQSEVVKRQPIELLTLSACETAEGNDRAPLGIAGAAIRARAKSVLGTLWPVEDSAARMTMETFYAGVVSRISKASALQQAQLRLIRDPQLGHPFFWAPFSLIGNWR